MTPEEKEKIKNEIDTANKITIIKNDKIFKELLNSDQVRLIDEVLQYVKSRLTRDEKQDDIVSELIVSNLLAVLDTPNIFKSLLPEEQIKLTGRLRDYLIDQIDPSVEKPKRNITRSITTKNMLSSLNHLDKIFPGQQSEYHFRITVALKKRILHRNTGCST